MRARSGNVALRPVLARWGAVVLSVSALFVPSTAFAMDQSVADALKAGKAAPSVPSAVPATGGSSILGLFEFILALGAVAVAAYFTIRFLAMRARAGGTGNATTVLTHSLGTGKTLQVVRVHDRLLLLGVGDTVNLLGEITDEQQVGEWLRSLGQSLDDAAAEPRAGSDFEATLRERIAALTRGRRTDAGTLPGGDREEEGH